MRLLADKKETPSALIEVLKHLDQIVVGKSRQVRLSLACILARGHLLVEDLPGMGKTTLAHALAKVMHLDFQRLQFTSDLLPADITGVSIYDRNTASFSFHPGPVFTQLMLADEINRATPKAQSALLEAMEEGQVTVEGETRQLPEPFFVVATQNPIEQSGTFALPESQLDRFLMRIELGYPDHKAEREILSGRNRKHMMTDLQAVLNQQQLLDFQQQVSEVFASDAVLDYLQQILAYTRQSGEYRAGISPRGGLSLLAAAKAWAFLDGRNHMLPEDIKAVVPCVLSHRLQPVDGRSASLDHQGIENLLQAVSVNL
ncbi:AAA family ATPase [Pelagibaculum spongiae]|uniref:AAA family ATPase n=1 Tax=Pelagibaculum spongiae TaxID=2080658 RepID=A0A2V1GWX3_9GAMM|nr:AAA family ATPase [Pelagibaculum spongiae]PVZ71681.1 AAA family ATPase [Pelagibaculum spongiae]